MSGTRAPETLPNSLAWAQRAACKGMDLESFFSEAEWNVADAKRICGPCPVREQCLTEGMHAEHAGSRYGIYGGLTPQERTELAGERPKTGRPAGKRSPRAHLSPCGTDAAYRRHHRWDEEPCKACRAANAERLRKQAQRRQPVKCGTRPGYQKHLRDKTEICEPCRIANTQADRRLRTTGSTKAPT
ncbi:WhiB family transcriptional regulator [Streptomyces sp. NPDC058534]|uniref:WhiB family transcriptional regulator n=1 Tax=Streptomyces sp. NPDC058534 TaxID=3346541 RepID=UPI00364DF327